MVKRLTSGKGGKREAALSGEKHVKCCERGKKITASERDKIHIVMTSFILYPGKKKIQCLLANAIVQLIRGTRAQF